MDDYVNTVLAATVCRGLRLHSLERKGPTSATLLECHGQILLAWVVLHGSCRHDSSEKRTMREVVQQLGQDIDDYGPRSRSHHRNRLPQ